MLPDATKNLCFHPCAGRYMLVRKCRPWYNQDAVDPFGGREVLNMNLLVTFIVSVAAGVIAHYICKWWDGDHRL